MPEPFIDVMATSVPQPSRWDRGDAGGAIRTLDAELAKAGLPGRLAEPLRLLTRAEELAEAGRREKEAAAARMEAATAALLADGPLDLAAYGQALAGVAPWLDSEAGAPAALVGIWNAGHRLRSNAQQMVFGMAHGLHAELQRVCAQVVAEVAAVPALPQGVWTAATSGQASTLAIRAGLESAWSSLVRLGDRWDTIHAAALLLRETGQFQQDLMDLDGCPTELGLLFLNWQPAVEQLPQVRRMPPPLRVRGAHDRGFRPGLYLRADHVAYQARAVEPRRGLLARLAGG
jgi:hypothetical protein